MVFFCSKFLKPKKIDFKPKEKKKGKSKTGRIEARKKLVKGAVIKDFVKEIKVLKRKEEKKNAKIDEDKTTKIYNVLDRFNKKK
jgi:hypothetical protein